MAIVDFVDTAKSIAKDKLGDMQDDVGNAQDEDEKEVNGAPQGTDHRPKSAGHTTGDATDNEGNDVNHGADLSRASASDAARNTGDAALNSMQKPE
jgi:uncharacterized protein YjbJ (UPF0337 family)